MVGWELHGDPIGGFRGLSVKNMQLVMDTFVLNKQFNCKTMKVLPPLVVGETESR